ncbi:MAG: formylglycine-generating enzyme family protein [Magnetococcus sp. YQC-5]
MQFKLLEPGTFTMGSPATETGRDKLDEKPHKVTISKAFYMGTTEVTQGQWKAVMGTNPSFFSSCGNTCPVEMISWNDIQTFLITLNAMGEGVYRLPTEAEWEYAARAGTITMYSFGADSASNYAWYESNSGKITHPVATKSPNPWGLYDMLGNVWEWVSDWYYADYNPLGIQDGWSKVLRGGSITSPVENLRSAERYFFFPENQKNYIGFRIVKVP